MFQRAERILWGAQSMDDAETLRLKAHEWRTQAAHAPERWRPLYEMLAAEYDRVAKERPDPISQRTW
jgi:hypothetical protein